MSPRRLRCEDVGAGMSVCWLDYDNDGAEDLYVANMWTAAGERVSMQDVFKKDSPEEVRAFIRSTRWEILCCETAAMRLMTQQSCPVLEWAAGRGRAMPSISITTDSLIFTSRMAWFPGPRAWI